MKKKASTDTPLYRGHILALDVAAANTGLALYSLDFKRYEQFHTIKTKPMDKVVAKSHIMRINSICFELEQFTKQHHIAMTVAEFPHGGARSAKAVSLMMLAFGAYTAALRFLRTGDLHSVTRHQVKKYLGIDTADKKVTTEHAKALAVLADPNMKRRINEHVADAILICETFISTNKVL